MAFKKRGELGAYLICKTGKLFSAKEK